MTRAIRQLVFSLLCAVLAAPALAQDRQVRLLDTLPINVAYVDVFGQRTAYYEGGKATAPVLILLPNLGWDSHAWAQNFVELGREYRVIAVDPLGFGRSAKPLLDYKMDTWTDFLNEFMRVKRIGQAAFAGAVMGGALSVQMALDYPDRVQAIVVAASNSGPGPHQGGMAIPSAPSLAGTRANLMALFHDSTLISDVFVRSRFAFHLRTNDGYTVQRHLADHRAPYSIQELARIKVPALVVWCREDRITPLAWGESYAAAFPDNRLAVLGSCGHLPNIERPEAFNEVLLNFLRNARLRPSRPDEEL
jgi:pimeloyl-ACP methyl ester carboxylesterase